MPPSPRTVVAGGPATRDLARVRRRRGRASGSRSAGGPRPPPPDVRITKRSPAHERHVGGLGREPLDGAVAPLDRATSPAAPGSPPRRPAGGCPMRSPRTVTSASVSSSITVSTPSPPRHSPGPPESGQQPGRAHDERVLRLERLELGDHRAPTEEERAGRVGPVRAGARAEPAELVEQAEPPLAVAVEPGERETWISELAADAVVGRGRAERGEDRLDRGGDGHHAAAAGRRAAPGSRACPMGRWCAAGGSSPRSSAIVGIDEAAHRVDDARQRLRERRVDHAARLRRRPREVDVDGAVALDSVTAACTSKSRSGSTPSLSIAKLPE